MNLKQFYMQALKFVGISGLGWCLDFTLYSFLSFLGISLLPANIAGSTVGVSFVFFTSTRFIFKNQGPVPLYVKYVLYVVYQAVLILGMSKLLVVMHAFLTGNAPVFLPAPILPLLAKMLITPVSMVINFVVLKGLIEKV